MEERIKFFLHTRPFRPFIIELENGSAVAVDHPEAVIIRSGRVVYMNPRGIASIFDAESVTQVTGPSKPIKIS